MQVTVGALIYFGKQQAVAIAAEMKFMAKLCGAAST
jgi:hypothetical protein